MGGLILCRETAVQHPYYVSELGLHLYSGEELSYFICHNIPLIGEDFPDERLSVFLEELGYRKLAERAERCRGQAEVYELLTVILQEIRYYGGSELYAFRRQLEEFRQAPVQERRKRKADYLFSRGQYYNALKEYEEVLALSRDAQAGQDFIGRLWHNMGSVYARTEAYADAFRCYLKAYSLLRLESVLEELFALCRLDSSLKLPEETAAMLLPELTEKYRRHFEEQEKQAVFEGKALEAAALREKPEEERAEAYTELLEHWKEEYRRNEV